VNKVSLASRVKKEFYQTFLSNGYDGYVAVTLDTLTENEIELIEIWSEIKSQAGWASKVMKLLASICDAHGVSISLRMMPLRYTPSALMDKNNLYSNRNAAFLSKAALTDWYERHGFVFNQGSKVDMRRLIHQPISDTL
jgi:hypothetical protein